MRPPLWMIVTVGVIALLAAPALFANTVPSTTQVEKVDEKATTAKVRATEADVRSEANTAYLRGERGQPGLTGAPGKDAVGQRGATGKNGKQGAQGDRGETGTSGATGEQGASGVQGDAGAQGKDGTNGAAGETGPQGPPGPEGPRGPEGPQGPPGATPDLTGRTWTCAPILATDPVLYSCTLNP